MTLPAVMQLSEAAGLIKDGSTITFGGFGVYLQPMALVRELIRQKKRNLKLLSVGEAYAADLLVGGGCVSHVALASFGFEAITGRARNFCTAVQRGDITVEDYSHFGMSSRLMAGAMGLPFAAVRSMIGSDLVNTASPEMRLERFTCPFTGENVLLLPAATPEVAVIQAQRADQRGNVQVFGPTICIEEQAKAASTTIAIVEEIVPRSAIQQQPSATIVSSFLVDALVVLPYSAHPMAAYRYYDYDLEHLRAYANASTSIERWERYLQEFVYSHVDHVEYLDRIGGMRKMAELRADPYLGY